MAKKPLEATVSAITDDHSFYDLLRLNLFSNDIEFTKEADWSNTIHADKCLEDEDLTAIRYYLSRTHGIEPSKQIVGEACYIVASRRSYHPIKQFIEQEEWDGVPRIDEWLIKASGCDDNKYTREVSAKFLIATVNRVYNPGCKFDHMVIFEGSQGLCKSTLVETIAGKFYLDTTFAHRDKDLVDAIRTSMIIEISELSGMDHKDVNWLKGFITRKVDRARLAYAMLTKDFKRKCVLVGTFNPSGNNTYLRDDTGNRRFWPIECKKIDIEYIKANRGQLWAEALSRKDEKYYLDDPETLLILSSLHEDRELESLSFYKIRDWINKNPDKDYVLMYDIIESGLGINTHGKEPRELLSYQTMAGIMMRKLKWVKGSNNNRDKYYINEEAKLKHTGSNIQENQPDKQEEVAWTE